MKQDILEWESHAICSTGRFGQITVSRYIYIRQPRFARVEMLWVQPCSWSILAFSSMTSRLMVFKLYKILCYPCRSIRLLTWRYIDVPVACNVRLLRSSYGKAHPDSYKAQCTQTDNNTKDVTIMRKYSMVALRMWMIWLFPFFVRTMYRQEMLCLLFCTPFVSLHNQFLCFNQNEHDGKNFYRDT